MTATPAKVTSRPVVTPSCIREWASAATTNLFPRDFAPLWSTACIIGAGDSRFAIRDWRRYSEDDGRAQAPG